MSPAEICRQTGILPPQWSRFATGERRISLDSALVLKRLYGASLDWIYTGDTAGLPLKLAASLNLSAPPLYKTNYPDHH